jgi:hypothetical protein
MKNLIVIISVALGILLIIGYEEFGLDIGIGVKNQIVVGVLFLFTAIAFKVNFKAPKDNLSSKGSNMNAEDSELKKSKLEKLIENDPEIKKIDQEMRDLVDSQLPILLRIKKNRPDHWKIMVQKGLVPADLKDEDDDSIDFNNQPQSTEMNKNKILSVFLRFFFSGEMKTILFIAGVVFIFFLSPEGQPANRGEDGNGTWNLWVGVLIWGVMVVSYFLEDKMT